MSKLHWTYASLTLFVCAVVAVSPAQTLTTLHSFSGSDGAHPYAPLLQAADGNLYGTAFAGGATGDGTVFEITTSGTLTTLHSFNRFVLNDGREPYAGLIEANDGNLYGTTSHGGVGTVGTIFKVTPSGVVSTLQSFIYLIDGANTQAALTKASNGVFYGTAANGGNNGSGTIFLATTFRQLDGIYSFGADNSSSPVGGLVQVDNEDLYGTTYFGGAGDCGTIFRVTITGSFTSLHSFTGLDGCLPYGTMTVGSDGNLYGTTTAGGERQGANAGVAFSITPAGALTILHVFDGTDGSAPTGTLIQANDGNFYGTTQAGGAFSKGTIFRMTPSGTLTTLYSFCAQNGCADGATPIAGLVQADNGIFYGTTYAGGASNDGIVFSFSPGQ